MNKIKTVYYIFYIIIIISIFFFAIYTEPAIDLMYKWKWFKYLTDVIKLLQIMLFIISGLLIFEIIIENTHIFKLKKKNKSLNKEIMSLKAKLYDNQVAREEKLLKSGSPAIEEGSNIENEE